MLIAKNLSYENADGKLFQDVDISLDSAAKKRVAIVGKNGCGKSTLLKILMGQIEQTAGTVNCSHEIIGYLKQDISFPDETKTVAQHLESKLEEEWMTYKIEMVLTDVGMDLVSSTLPMQKLSGGQRVRIALAEVLLTEPTILLLDEPTNHLDHDGIEWLVGFVNNFNGTVAFISHDRHFINAVADQIWEITSNHNIEVYGCKYDQFLIERYNRYQKMLAAHEFSQREVTELEAWLKENANHPKYKFTATVAQKKKALERMEKKAPPEPIPDPRIKMRNLDPTEKGTVLSLKLQSKKFGGDGTTTTDAQTNTDAQSQPREILRDLDLKILNGERILIKGPNGSGKTTLLNILSGEDKDFEGKLTLRDQGGIGYLHQFSSLDPESTVLEEFGKKTSIEYTLGRSVLSKYLFPADFMESKIKNLSYGQQRRLELAILLTNKPSVLLLDEPTNHLDIFLREDLERFLLEQDVAMCIISHDTYFIDKIGITKTIELN